jgi:hypothetical protein
MGTHIFVSMNGYSNFCVYEWVVIFVSIYGYSYFCVYEWVQLFLGL